MIKLVLDAFTMKPLSVLGSGYSEQIVPANVIQARFNETAHSHGDWSVVIGANSMCNHNGCLLIGSGLVSQHDRHLIINENEVSFADCDTSTAIHILNEMHNNGVVTMNCEKINYYRKNGQIYVPSK